ncbi:MAG: transcription antitermination factor NusB [Actinomycetales bacterium]
MSARSKARKAALDLLYESDIRNRPVIDLLNDRLTGLDFLIRDYTRNLILGVAENKAKIDEIILMRAKGWDLDRMPVIDRNILRLGAFELLWSTEIPANVAISEAVELAKTLSTEESASYINGVMAAILEVKSDLVL